MLAGEAPVDARGEPPLEPWRPVVGGQAVRVIVGVLHMSDYAIQRVTNRRVLVLIGMSLHLTSRATVAHADALDQPNDPDAQPPKRLRNRWERHCAQCEQCRQEVLRTLRLMALLRCAVQRGWLGNVPGATPGRSSDAPACTSTSGLTVTDKAIAQRQP